MQNGLSTASPESQIQQKEMARIRNLIQQFETDIPFYERERLEKNKNVFSIGPRGRPIEHAFHCDRQSDGNIEIGIHVADVTHFVPHSATCGINSKNVEFVARLISETTFLPDRDLTIFPTIVANAASLTPGNNSKY